MALALSLPAQAWQSVEWRDGSNATLTGRFAQLRIRPALTYQAPLPEETLRIEWSQGEEKPTKFWFSTLPDSPLTELVDRAKLRWRIERDYQELKQEIGLGHFEGRSWRGFHHHFTLCIAAYAFLITQAAAFPPSASKITKKPTIPDHLTRRAVTNSD